MTPKQLHNQIMRAYTSRPQNSSVTFEEMDYNRRHKNSPATLEDVVVEWLYNDTLWRLGYHEELPIEAKNLFNRIFELQKQAIRQACEEVKQERVIG